MRHRAVPPWAALSRRGLLRAGTGGAAAVLVQQAMLLDAAAQSPASRAGYAFFNPQDAATLEAIVDRLWPETDTPGGVEAGAAAYIDGALIGPYQGLATNYHRGLRLLDAAARQAHGRAFRRLEAGQQDALLNRMQADDLPGYREGEASRFFGLLLRHTMEGLFADPIYGGNRDFAGWRAVGYPGPFYLISEQRQQSFEPLDMPRQSIADL